jgi:IPT/TIG domain
VLAACGPKPQSLPPPPRQEEPRTNTGSTGTPQVQQTSAGSDDEGRPTSETREGSIPAEVRHPSIFDLDPDGAALRNIDPARGDAAGGMTVRIYGMGFTKVERKARVFFGKREGAVVKIVSDSEMIVRVPAGTGTVDVKVEFEPGGGRTMAGAFTYDQPKL